LRLKNERSCHSPNQLSDRLRQLAGREYQAASEADPGNGERQDAEECGLALCGSG